MLHRRRKRQYLILVNPPWRGRLQMTGSMMTLKRAWEHCLMPLLCDRLEQVDQFFHFLQNTPTIFGNIH